MTTPDLTPVRGHLARVGSPAEAYLVAWAEVDTGPEHVVAAQELAVRTLAHVTALRLSPDPVQRERWGRRGIMWRAGQAMRRAAVQAVYATQERADLAGWLLLLAQDAEGYVGEEG